LYRYNTDPNFYLKYTNIHVGKPSVEEDYIVEVGLPLPGGGRWVTRTIVAVTWTIRGVINWGLRPYALLGLSLPGVTRLVTWTIRGVVNWCFDCEITW
jgi:hypothetical protein